MYLLGDVKLVGFVLVWWRLTDSWFPCLGQDRSWVDVGEEIVEAAGGASCVSNAVDLNP